MKKALRKFIINTLLVSLILCFLGGILFSTVLNDYYSHIYIVELLFFGVVNIVLFSVIMKASKLRPAMFSSYFILSTGIKLLAYLIVLVVYLFIYRKDAIPFVIVFFFLYLVFTVFEVVSVLAFLKNIDAPQQPISK